MGKIYSVVTATGFAALSIFAAGAAAADPYMWCALYGAYGTTNCGFTTIEQCRATVSGAGGSCTENKFYTVPKTTSAKHIRKHSQG